MQRMNNKQSVCCQFSNKATKFLPMMQHVEQTNKQSALCELQSTPPYWFFNVAYNMIKVQSDGKNEKSGKDKFRHCP